MELSVVAKSALPAPFGVVALAQHLNTLPTSSSASNAQIAIKFEQQLTSGDNVQLAMNGFVKLSTESTVVTPTRSCRRTIQKVLTQKKN